MNYKPIFYNHSKTDYDHLDGAQKKQILKSLSKIEENGMNVGQPLVRETNRIITIVPADEKEYNCPLLGAAVGSKLTVERFLEMAREDNENEIW